MGDLESWSCAARGWESRSFFVRFLYKSRALLKINWKLEDEEAAGLERDMRGSRSRALEGDGWEFVGDG